MTVNHLQTLPRHLSVNETVRAMDAAERASTATTADTLQAGSCPGIFAFDAMFLFLCQRREMHLIDGPALYGLQCSQPAELITEQSVIPKQTLAIDRERERQRQRERGRPC